MYDEITHLEELPRLLPKIRSILGDISSSPQDRLNRVSAVLSTVMEAKERPVRGGLAPWQVRRLKMFVEEKISGAIRSTDMARLVCLSPHHFCRAFQISLKVTPHGYIINRRIERACMLMTSTPESLGQIAIECGFADQAHFNRHFRKHLDVSPGRWRRMQDVTTTP